MYFSRCCTLLLLLSLFLIHNSSGQQTPLAQPAASCAIAPLPSGGNEGNIFTEQQEEWLGEIVTHQFQQEYNVITDPDQRLEKIGARLLAQLPPGKLHYRFTIIDFPINNALSFVGGSVYVARRLVALAETEDDLAAVLAHEIGHEIAHQSAIEFSRRFKSALGVTQFTDRKDLFDKWNLLLDTAAKRKEKYDEKRGEQDELIADRIGLYAMIRAGYDPRHAADFFDRVTQLKGNKGNFWTDLFHETKPESKRLREMLRNSGPIPPQCVTALPEDNTTQFLTWQKTVIEAGFAVGKEEIPGLQKKTLLKPALRGDLDLIQFSPDGKTLLAQDDSSIFVVSREPLANLFRIDAPDSFQAQFTPDSQAIVFYDKELRVQKWDIAKRERVWIRQVAVNTDCDQSSLSPSGDVLACLSQQAQPSDDYALQFQVQLIDVANSQPFFARRNFYEPSYFELLSLLIDLDGNQPLKFFNLRFSPDSHYFVVGHAHAALGYDLQSRTEVKLPKKIKELMTYNFTFLAPDKLAGYDADSNPRKIVQARFPSGEVVDAFPSPGYGEFTAANKGNFLLLLHAGKYASVLVDLDAKKVINASKAPGFAVYDRVYAGETVGGALALINAADNKVMAQIQLPESPLAATRASAFSTDGKWLALSGKTRGGIWKLDTGDRVFFTVGFAGALFDHNDLFAHFPKRDDFPERVLKLDASTLKAEELYKIETDNTTAHSRIPNFILLPGTSSFFFSVTSFSASTRQMGDLLVTVIPDLAKKNLASTLSVHDIRTNKQLWEQKTEREIPTFYYSDSGKTLTLVIANYDNIKTEAKNDPALNAKLAAIEGKQGKKDSYVVRAFDAMSGKNLGAVLVDTGNLSFKVHWATTTGDTVLVGDSRHRTLIYSLKTGEQRGKILGEPRAVSKAGDRVLVDTGKGEADLYDVASLQPVAHFTFPSRIIRAEFTDDGSGLFILTADQNVYSVKNPTLEATGR
jgi:WD40 repeat protein